MNIRIGGTKMQFNLLLFLFLLIIISCHNESPRGAIIDLDKATDVSSSRNSLSSLIDSYRIIQLESSSDCILGRINKIVKANSLFFIKTSGTELVLFDDSGNYLRKFGKKGRGPGEYIEISDFAVNTDGSIVAISSQKDILFYRVNDGHFIRKQHLGLYINSLCYLPNEEILAQVTQANFLIAHVDTSGNIINSFGSMNRVLELEQQFEFVRLDNSNFIYRVGETTNFYLYNFQKKSFTKNKIFQGKNTLNEQELNDELIAAGPDAYLHVGDFLRNHYSIKYIKVLGSNILISYLYQGNSSLLLYNRDKHIKSEFVFRPEESSNLVDDVLMLSSEVFLQVNAAGSDDNSILIYLYPEMIKKYLKGQSINTPQDKDDIYELFDKVKPEDNPLIVEYKFKEI